MVKRAKRLDMFSEYVFSRLQKKIAEVEQKSNRKVLNFGIGNPDIVPSSLYINKLTELIKESDAHLYPGFGANNKFTEGLTNWYEKRFKVSLEKDELLPLLGAKDGVSHLPLALLDQGDEVLVPDPGYPAYTDPALMIGGKVIYYDLLEKNNFQISLQQLKRKISNKTKFIWINFPANPTGQIITLGELEKIIAFAKEKNIFIVYDNAYSEITFDGFIAPSILQIKGAKEIAAEIGSFSKTFSFAGFRMGWMVGNKEIIAALAKVKSQMDSGLPASLQNLAAFVLSSPDQKWQRQMLSNYRKRRDTITNYLQQIGLTFSLPKGSLYIWAKIPRGFNDAEEFCMKMLSERQVLFAPGTAFGKNGQGFVRVSISVNIDKIGEYFKS